MESDREVSLVAITALSAQFTDSNVKKLRMTSFVFEKMISFEVGYCKEM